jgi:spore germination cell wall hydrolase CwlJ-like protein
LAAGLGLLPTGIGHQDLVALAAQRPSVAAPSHSHIIASPFGTIEKATFTLPAPISEAMPRPLSFVLAGLDPGNADITGSIRERILGDVDLDVSSSLPQVDRRLKGDRLALHPRPQGEGEPIDRSSAEVSAPPSKKADRLAVAREAEPGQTAPAPVASAPPAEQAPPQFSVGALEEGADDDEPPPPFPPPHSASEDARERASAGEGQGGGPDLPARPSLAATGTDADSGEAAGVDATMRMARLYFSVDPKSPNAVIRPWLPGEAPQLDMRDGAPDADFKTAALEPPAANLGADARESFGVGGETIAAKGEVTGAGQHPMSPAERLHLDEKGRAKAMKCLTQAIYFEARGEPVRGQIAVAQVVMNRVFSGYYPGTVCGVVYQNANRHLACQFTFACDGLPEVVREPDAWERAKKIAAETLDGELWLPEVGKATHYHAYWVHPSWVHEMTRMYKLGVHTFYRPKRWGAGADAPEWGDAAATAAAAKNL